MKNNYPVQDKKLYNKNYDNKHYNNVNSIDDYYRTDKSDSYSKDYKTNRPLVNSNNSTYQFEKMELFGKSNQIKASQFSMLL